MTKTYRCGDLYLRLDHGALAVLRNCYSPSSQISDKYYFPVWSASPVDKWLLYDLRLARIKNVSNDLQIRKKA